MSLLITLSDLESEEREGSILCGSPHIHYMLVPFEQQRSSSACYPIWEGVLLGVTSSPP